MIKFQCYFIQLIMEKKMGNNRWLSMNEICEYLGISRDTALKWINNKNMPAHKIDKLWRFKVNEIDDWVRSNGQNKTDQEND